MKDFPAFLRGLPHRFEALGLHCYLCEAADRLETQAKNIDGLFEANDNLRDVLSGFHSTASLAGRLKIAEQRIKVLELMRIANAQKR